MSAVTLPLNFMGDRRGFLRWRIAGRHADGTVQYTHEFMTQRTDPIDSRCMTGRVMCATKNGLRLWWVIDGKILKSFDARFGKESLPTREGVHSVYWKSRYHVSSIYHVDMPWAMFFNGGQAVHYSAGFASMGHIGAGSAGCINLRDMAGIEAVLNIEHSIGIALQCGPVRACLFSPLVGDVWRALQHIVDGFLIGRDQRAARASLDRHVA